MLTFEKVRGTLEIRSKEALTGLTRIFSAFISSLFLGIAMTSGSFLYGLADKNATSDPICPNHFDWRYNSLWVGAHALCLLLVNQARWRQAPVMVGIAIVGYVANYFATLRFVAGPQYASIVGGLTIGLLGNVYSRVGHGMGFVAMLPSIFVQAPGALVPVSSLITFAKGDVNSAATPSLGALSLYYFWCIMFQLAFGTAFGLWFSGFLLSFLKFHYTSFPWLRFLTTGANGVVEATA